MTIESVETQKACELVGCSEATLRKYVKSGKLRVCKVGKTHRYLIDDLKTLFDYATQGDNSNVVDFGKHKQQTGGNKPCRKSTNAGKRGISTIPMSTTNEYEKLLERQ